MFAVSPKRTSQFTGKSGDSYFKAETLDKETERSPADSLSSRQEPQETKRTVWRLAPRWFIIGWKYSSTYFDYIAPAKWRWETTGSLAKSVPKSNVEH